MKIITISITDESIMAHYPGGKLEFLTFIQFLKLAWWGLRHNVEIVIEDRDMK